MKVLIIGGSRFVGPLIIDKLLQDGHKVTVFNRGRIKRDYPRGVKHVVGDRNAGFNLTEKFNVVIDDCAYNGMQTQTALRQLRFNFFVHFSTAAVYKKTGQFLLTEESPLGEWPMWGEYNRGKVDCEQVLAQSGIGYASVRPVYILGPHNYVDREHFIYSRIKSGKPLILPGDGQAKVQFVFAEEVAELFRILVEEQVSGAFNCAGDDVITLVDLVREMGEIVGEEPMIKFNSQADGANFRLEEFPFANETFYCTNQKAKDLGISFAPLTSGLKRDYDAYYRGLI